nr:response regulator [Acidimicrobiia bacterium]
MASSGITGALGGRWRADVTAWGAIEPWDGSPPLEWHVAADDRWHTPASDTTVRQRRVGGTPVFETRVHVPGGDAVHRCYSVAAAGGATVIELTNDSPLPIAVALTRPDLLTNRPPTDVGVQGIDLPAGTIVVPIGHRTSVTVALPHDGGGPGPLPGRLAGADEVARGWHSMAERSSRLELPDPSFVDAVVAARCDLLLAGPPPRDVDTVGYLLAVGELVRLGELPTSGVAALVEDVAAAVEDTARREGWDVDAALDVDEALRRIDVTRYALVVTDFWLPRFNGAEVIAYLHALGD